MSGLALVPKPFNYYGITITGNHTLEADTHNVVYATLLSPATLHLPDLLDVIDGFPVIVKNYGPADLQIRDASDVFVADLLAGAVFELIANRGTVNQWRAVLGPIGGGSGVSVSGPGVSTDDAVVLWNGTSGGFIKNSSVLIDPTGDISGVQDLSVSGAASFASGVNLTGGNLVYTSGLNSTIFSNTPSGGTHTWTFRNTNDSVVGLSTADTLINKNLLSLTNNIACNYLNSATTQVRVNTAPAPVGGQVLTATTPTSAVWQTPAVSLSGPAGSTDSAVALWNGAGGSVLKDSSVIIDGIGNISGVNDLNAGGDLSGTNVLLVGGSLTYQSGGNSTTLTATPSATRSLALPDANDTLVGRDTSDVLNNKTITSATNNVYANGLNTATGTVVTTASADPIAGQVVVATGANTAEWVTVGDATITPGFPLDWLSIPTSVQNSLDGLAATAGQNLRLGVDPIATSTGVDQSTAYLLNKYFTNITTAPLNTGVILPVNSGGVNIRVKNNGANSVAVYPQVGGDINALGVNNPYTLVSGASVALISTSTTHWETV